MPVLASSSQVPRSGKRADVTAGEAITRPAGRFAAPYRLDNTTAGRGDTDRLRAVRRVSLLDLETATVRVRAAYIERSTGEMLLGPPKSKAGRRVVGIPDVIIPALCEHLWVFVKDEPSALVFAGQKGVPLGRGNINRMSGWPQAVRIIGMAGLRFHDLRPAVTTSRRPAVRA